MTTDELITKLNDEHELLESELQKAYENYGRVAYKRWQKPPDGSGPPNYELHQITSRGFAQQITGVIARKWGLLCNFASFCAALPNLAGGAYV